MYLTGLCRSRRGALAPPLLPLALVLLAGCSINPRLELSRVDDAGPPSVSLPAPFFPQTENECGPAALATVLTASGVDAPPESLTSQVYLPAREGSLQVELMAAARRHGRIPYPLEPRVEDLLAEIRHGRPVLVLQNLRTPGFPAWHYAVLVGYDVARNEFQLNSGTEQGKWMPAPRFLRTWDWADRWAIVALRPGELPAVVQSPAVAAGEAAEPYFQAVADFESVAGTEAAMPAWRAAAGRWPDHHRLALAFGNHAYRRGDLDAAAQWYFRGLEQQPEDPALANNLATVLGDAGCARAGEAVLHPVAAALGSQSVWTAPVERTLRELAAREGRDPDRCASYAAGGSIASADS